MVFLYLGVRLVDLYSDSNIRMEAELMRKVGKMASLHVVVNIGLAYILLLLLLALSTRLVLRVDLNKRSLYTLSPRSHAF